MPCYSEPYGVEVDPTTLDTITRLACDRCKDLESKGEVPEWAARWWDLHKLADVEREKREADKKARDDAWNRTLASMPPEDQAILGFKKP